MKKFLIYTLSPSVLLAASLMIAIGYSTASAAEQDAIDGCIDKLREVGGPDARNGGEVLSSEFSEAATLVMLRDSGGTEWRCLAYSDGTVADLSVTNAAEDGGGAMAGAGSSGIPAFSAECPQQYFIQTDGSGTVRVNGGVASVEKFNDQYYEARLDGITYSISMEADGSGLQVSFNPPGSAGGYCNIVSQGSGQAASSGGTGEPTTTTERVSFPSGETGTELSGDLTPGSSVRYVLNARDQQNLYVRVAHRGGPRLDYQIFNPDGSFLLDMISTEREYRGQLWQSGDHVIEVINRGGATAEYNVIFGID